METIRNILLFITLVMVVFASKDDFLSTSYIIKSTIAGIAGVAAIILIIKQLRDRNHK